jgi:hypothetical protein
VLTRAKGRCECCGAGCGFCALEASGRVLLENALGAVHRLSRVNPLGRLASIKLAGEGRQVVAGDNLGAATRKVSHPSSRSPISTEFS